MCQPIGVVVGGRSKILGDNWGGVGCTIRLDGRFSPDCLWGLEKFSHVEGLDAMAGTPVLDLKPVMREFEPRGGIRQPGWATELMQDYHA